MPGFDFSLLPPLQLFCTSVQEMKLSSSLSVVNVPLGARSLLCDSSTDSLCPLVPLQLRRQLFNLLYDVSGVRASPRLVSIRFVWPGLSHNVTCGLNLASDVKRVKSQPKFILVFQPFQFPPGDFLTVLISWVLCPLVKVTFTS